MNKKIISFLIFVGIVIISGYFFFVQRPDETLPGEQNLTVSTSTDVQTEAVADETKTILGSSVEKREIVAYHFGSGESEILFVGGIHGGYEWNTTLVANELIDYLESNPDIIPKNVKITVIPVLNPDGLNRVVGVAGAQFSKADVSVSTDLLVSGRFNANGVDLNRNFDCDWQPEGVWQRTTVSGGTKSFSEPESQAIKSYVEANKPIAVVVWYSAAGGVFASSCHNGVSSETKSLTNIYAKASGYKAYESFDFYETTGDMANWLAKYNIPAISVILSNHTETEWDKNRQGVDALMDYYSK